MTRKIPLILCVLLSSLFIGCSDDASMQNVDLDESTFLANMSSNIIIPAHKDFAEKTELLSESVAAFSSDITVENLQDLEGKLKEARLSWQSCNMFAFGPASDLALTSEANIFPVDQNQIEKNIETGSYDLGTIANNDTKGLPGIAYLIYGESLSEIEIIESFTTDALAVNRINYLKDLAERLAEKSKEVSNQWETSYLSRFTSNSSYGTSVGSSASLLFNAMIMIYERNFRDGKIGIPAGVRSLGETIPNSVEAYHGGYSLELAKANLNQFKSVFNGNGSAGLDDYLEAYDKAELVAEVNEKFDAIASDLDNLTDPLSTQIATNNVPAESVFVSMQDLVNLLKTDVASQLSISITFIDSDGD